MGGIYIPDYAEAHENTISPETTTSEGDADVGYRALSASDESGENDAPSVSDGLGEDVVPLPDESRQEPEPSEQVSPQSGDNEVEAGDGTVEPSIPSIRYASHVAQLGWQGDATDGTISGTTGRSLSIEALTISIPGFEGSLEYQAHVADYGWQDFVADGETAGTTGHGRAMEAVRIRLVGEIADEYDVYYQPHSADLGWLGWARNGEPAGSAGYGLGLEAIKIKLVPKGTVFSDYGTVAFQERMLSYQAHVSDIGWQSSSYDGTIAGTTGQSLALEALQVGIVSTVHSGSIESHGYVQHTGWQDGSSSGAIGTTGRSLSLQAIRLRLSGEIAESYDIYYRVHVSNIGWLDWTMNGETAGSTGYDLAIEAAQIVLTPKGRPAPGNTERSFLSRGLSYQAHVGDVGWQTPVVDRQTAGTTGCSRALEAVSISLGDQEYAGSIVYQAHVENIGWQDPVADGRMAGTTGKSLSVEAFRVKLEGDIADHYNVYYRVHSANLGWLDWAFDGATAGTVGCNIRAEAIQIVLVKNGDEPPGITDAPSRTLAYRYSANVRGEGWQNPVTGASTSGTTGLGLPVDQFSMTMEGSTFDGGIEYSVHSADVGWQDYVSDGGVAGIAGKQVEAIRIRLSGELATCFDVYYRAHVSNLGWLDWAKNDEKAGTARLGYQLEALQVVFVPKGGSAPGQTGIPYREVLHTQRVAELLQLPELPTGCESVALTIVLRSMGYDSLGKTEIADFYLARSSWDFVNAFAGDPYSSGGYINGAMPPAIVNAANKYLARHGDAARAQELKGASMETLYSLIDQGYPILVWTTAYMQRTPLFTGLKQDGYSWYNNEHCVVLYGYDRASGNVLVSDPLSGVVWRNASEFGDIYRRCGSMSAVIR